MAFMYDIYSPINLEWGLKRDNGSRKSQGWWRNVSMNWNLNVELVRAFQDKLSWFLISANRGLKCDNDFLEEFKDRIYWPSFVRVHHINEQTFLRFRRYINIMHFFEHTCEDRITMIEKYWCFVQDRGSIFKQWKFPIDFIKKHANEYSRLEWNIIACHQKLPVSFIREYKDHLSSNYLYHNPYVPQYLKDKIANGEF